MHSLPTASVSLDDALIWVAALLLIAVLANRLSDRLGVPSLLLFLAIGMLAGEEGPGGIPFDDARLAQSLGVVALAFILFAGGLGTEWGPVRRVMWRGLSLATLGVLITTALCAWFSVQMLGISWANGLLLGAIISSTDAAAVFSVLRTQRIELKGGIGPLLEMESGTNDPMAVLLTISLIRFIQQPDASALSFLWLFVLQMGLGLGIGYLSGRLTVRLINAIKLQSDGLYTVLIIASALLTYSVTASLDGSGFLAVYVAGLVIGNSSFIHKRSLVLFSEGLAWLMQIAMFLTLGLLVYPSRLLAVAGVSLAMALFLMLVARPVSVFVSLAFAKMGWQEKTMVSWVGLRGAVPIVLATFPLLAGIANSALYFNVVFFIVLTSVLVQGTSLAKVAEWLKLRSKAPGRRVSPLEFVPGAKSTSELTEIVVTPDSPVAGKQVVELRFPKSALIVLLNRDDEYLVPRGGTVIREGDGLLVLADKDDLRQLHAMIDPGAESGSA